MMLGLLLVLHGGDRMELAYFWSSIVIVALPIGVFVTIAVLAIRGSLRELRRERERGAGSST